MTRRTLSQRLAATTATRFVASLPSMAWTHAPMPRIQRASRKKDDTMNSSNHKLLRSLAAMPRLTAPLSDGVASARLTHQRALASPSLPQRAADLVWCSRLRGQQCLANPVSRPQPEFRLGYTHACYLAHHLAHDGIWTLAIRRDGTRLARFGTQGQA